jgi:hypothetical protein
MRRAWLPVAALAGIAIGFGASAATDAFEAEYAKYHAGNELGFKLFYEHLDRYGKFARVGKTLEACGQDDMAQKVFTLHEGADFAAVIRARMADSDEPDPLLYAQSKASGMMIGYYLGFGEAMQILLQLAETKQVVCQLAPQWAADVLP